MNQPSLLTYGPGMGNMKPSACRLHGPGIDPQTLVGCQLVSVVATWHHFPGEPVSGPLDVWLINDGRPATHITISADWCLVVDEGAPIDGYDMGEYGFVSVSPVGDATPFARHIGSIILAAREEHDPLTGRVALELDFADGGVRCDGWDGNLRLSDLSHGGPPLSGP